MTNVLPQQSYGKQFKLGWTLQDPLINYVEPAQSQASMIQQNTFVIPANQTILLAVNLSTLLPYAFPGGSPSYSEIIIQEITPVTIGWALSPASTGAVFPVRASSSPGAIGPGPPVILPIGFTTQLFVALEFITTLPCLLQFTAICQ